MNIYPHNIKRILIMLPIIIIFACTTALAGPSEDASLREATKKLDINAVKTALRRGANPNMPSSDPRPMTPLSLTSMAVLFDRNGNESKRAAEIFKILFAAGAKLGRWDRDILFVPISGGHVELVKLLLSHGASPTAKIEGYLPTQLALKYGQTEVYNLLLSHGGIAANNKEALQLSFIEAATNGQIIKMERAFKAGARIDAAGPDGMTALISALRIPIHDKSKLGIISWLLDHGADPNLRGESGFRDFDGIPLHVFVAINRGIMMGEITTLQDAQVFAEAALTRLLKAGAKVSGMDTQDRTPLHICAKVNNVRAAEILIERGARIMARDVKGKTPLDYAESESMIRLLRSHGASE